MFFRHKYESLSLFYWLHNIHWLRALLQHGYTPLYVAVMENQVVVVEELLKRGANRKLSPDVSDAL